MKKTIFALALILSTSAFAKATDKFKLIPAKTLSEWIKTNSSGVAMFDANNEKTRAEYGTIPGAKLLKSYDSFDPKNDLPQNKSTKLVFFCANTQCMASHTAAEHAAAAGYNEVYVMSDGIMGWKKSGFPTVAVAN